MIIEVRIIINVHISKSWFISLELCLFRNLLIFNYNLQYDHYKYKKGKHNLDLSSNISNYKKKTC